MVLTTKVKRSVESANNEVFPGEAEKVFGRLDPLVQPERCSL
jgi:hypothetical protein